MKCPHCDVSFKTKSFLRKHDSQVHRGLRQAWYRTKKEPHVPPEGAECIAIRGVFFKTRPPPLGYRVSQYPLIKVSYTFENKKFERMICDYNVIK